MSVSYTTECKSERDIDGCAVTFIEKAALTEISCVAFPAVKGPPSRAPRHQLSAHWLMLAAAAKWRRSMPLAGSSANLGGCGNCSKGTADESFFGCEDERLGGGAKSRAAAVEARRKPKEPAR